MRRSEAAPQAGVTVYTDTASNMQTAEVQIAADLAGAFIKTQVANAVKTKDLVKKASIPGNSFPYFQLTDSIVLTDSTAIARHLLRTNQQASETVLGTTSAFNEAKVDQYVAMASSSILPHVRTIEAAVYGPKEDLPGHLAAVKSLKETCKILNAHLEGKNWFVGSALTFADVHMFTTIAPAF